MKKKPELVAERKEKPIKPTPYMMSKICPVDWSKAGKKDRLVGNENGVQVLNPCGMV